MRIEAIHSSATFRSTIPNGNERIVGYDLVQNFTVCIYGNVLIYHVSKLTVRFHEGINAGAVCIVCIGGLPQAKVHYKAAFVMLSVCNIWKFVTLAVAVVRPWFVISGYTRAHLCKSFYKKRAGLYRAFGYIRAAPS